MDKETVKAKVAEMVQVARTKTEWLFKRAPQCGALLFCANIKYINAALKILHETRYSYRENLDHSKY